MSKALLLLALLTISISSVQLTVHEADDWKKLNVDNLSDAQKGLDEWIRDQIDALGGDLAGVAKMGDLYRYVYKNGDDENWDVQTKSDGKGNNEILVATRTQTYPDENDSNLTINKKTSIVKKALKNVIAAAV